jgi:hypothetical protein
MNPRNLFAELRWRNATRIASVNTTKSEQKPAAVDPHLSPQKWQADGKHTFFLDRQNCRKYLVIMGAGSRIRTDDLLITNQLLYQLSYAGACSI